MKDPARVVVVKDPGKMATEEAFVTFQESVAFPPCTMLAGDAAKDAITGGTGQPEKSEKPGPTSPAFVALNAARERVVV